jgi:hypothetical protein
MGFEPTIAALELAKTVHALDRAATVIGSGCAKCVVKYNPRSNQIFHYKPDGDFGVERRS